MTRIEFNSIVNTLFSDTAQISAASFRSFFETLGDLIFSLLDGAHTEAASGQLVADVATDIPFASAFANTDYAVAYRALDGSGQKVDCTIEKYADKLRVTALESDATFDFIAAKATISLSSPT